ncbi:MAG: type IV pilus assembly protein PilM [Planctomycetes bacterium]|nr:type IV pilus assembly protein PilM [Planctomycetota bacterium]
MLNILNRQKIELAGLDIGSSAVKLVRLNKSDDGYALIAAASESIVPCPDDEKQQRQNCIDAIKTCLQKAKLKNGNLVCGISGPEVVVRGFTFPPLPEEAVEQAIRMEAQQVCPLDMKHSVLDFQLIETASPASTDGAAKATTRQGVMTVGTENAIREQTELITRAGAKPAMVDVNALALLNCLNELGVPNAQETIAIIDIGNTLTNVVIYGVDGLPFVRDINIAGKHIIGEISRQTELSEDQIRQTLAQKQSPGPLDSNLLLAMNNAIGPLVNAINETLRFYSFQEKTSGVDRIFLCGGFALVDAFVEFLTDAVSTPVALLNPFSTILYDPNASGNETLAKDGPAFAVATGLAMRTL